MITIIISVAIELSFAITAAVRRQIISMAMVAEKGLVRRTIVVKTVNRYHTTHHPSSLHTYDPAN